MTVTEISKRLEQAGFDDYEIDYSAGTVTIHFDSKEDEHEPHRNYSDCK
ncbi:AcrR family transcriptional regulator [Sporomusaceae bacterium BoRhaA]|nr:hypothetical protein [Pelorhabdus rhamnosifermentans]MBU2703897.1 AcrR family transcriptional regulator [Pelorhabdus rhamnosifermentans]